ncbi:hypothetical protein BCV69DRAFT_281123 [Microstroma glucosiphilum]|uniref:Secreted peptide n=1 Tax=Pseudomicrostroma glucosiphilum TaxID=1684307 RepID=A0A316UCJ3_9BASI|nr:hypothetical protein BCV69DRAFT_281123 [Pseudomicrostroma glucosiphilum]PWN22123.1 hypothetical protein BCV69DRAFT_281123 [Pseudomicrostroma glucosiphilum]
MPACLAVLLVHFLCLIACSLSFLRSYFNKAYHYTYHSQLSTSCMFLPTFPIPFFLSTSPFSLQSAVLRSER